ncbi:ribbon-helix-helix domain-containing protein [Halorussus litoreus]|uniref:ribbon-helix-helix domain-containing protein n=1 Tax=Halorussus litoreus TaxID=1710536 RepID=UPI000E26397A|nr:ribbon-helix-helix domain-containing protein [Halorussus litoreus]
MALKTSLSFSVPIPWVGDIKDRAEEKGFGSVSEYIRSLVRKDIEQDDETKIALAKDGNGDLNEKGAA